MDLNPARNHLIMPTPTPENDQIENVREIARLSSFTESKALVSSLNDEQWAATLADIAAWILLKNQFTNLKGGRSGVDINPGRARAVISKRVRKRLGLSELSEAEDDSYSNSTGSVPIAFPW